MNQIKVIREKAFLNAAREIELHIGSMQFQIPPNNSIEVNLEEGEYPVYAKIDWIKTKPKQLTVINGNQIEIHLKPFIKSRAYFIALGILPIINTVIYNLEFFTLFWIINLILLFNFIYLFPYFTFKRSKYIEIEIRSSG